MTDDTARRAPHRAARLLAAALACAAATAARAGPGVIVSGSVYVDYWGIQDKEIAARSPRSVTWDASLKIGVDIHDDLSFSAKACASCHGIELEHMYLDFAPKSWFNVQVGRLLVPFGEYSQRIDASGHKTASAPLIYDMGRMAYGERTAMNLGVIPQPYTDTGVLVYGVKWIGEKIQTWYGVYGVSGLRGSNDVDWMAMRSVSYNDQNNEPAAGARIALAYSSDAGSFIGDASLGGSYTTGTYDRGAKLHYEMWGADASFKLGPFIFRGEYASRKTDLDPTAHYAYELVDGFFQKDGWYAELEHPLGKYLNLVYRYDELHRSGMPLPTSTLSTDTLIKRYTAGVVLTPAQAVFMKLGWEYWEPNELPKFQSFHVGLGGAF